MLDFSEYVNQFLRKKYYKILSTLLDRGELDLGQIMIESEGSLDKKLL